MTHDEAREQYRKDVEISEAAQQAQQNRAIMAYFEEAETKAIDAILDVDLAGDLTAMLRLITVAQTVRRMRVFLGQARNSGAFAKDALKGMEKDEGQ